MPSKLDIKINKDDFKRKLDIKDGKTPTTEEIVSLIKPLIPDPIPGEPGKDYILTQEDKKEIASEIEVPIVEKVIERTEVIKEQPIYNTTEVIKEVSKQITQEDITNIAVQINPIIEYSKIKNAPQWPSGGLSRITKPEVQAMIDAIPPATSTFTALTDTPATYTGAGLKGVRVNTGETALEFYTVVDTDEKVKYDATDISAGYLGAKTVAGVGITLAEGTGGDADKLKISTSFDIADYLTSASAASTYLKLDQTTPQEVINNRPRFVEGINFGSAGNGWYANGSGLLNGDWGSGFFFNLEEQYIADGNGVTTIETSARNLKASDGSTGLNYESRGLYTSGSVHVMDWENRLLVDGSGTDYRLDWRNGRLYSNDLVPVVKMDWFNLKFPTLTTNGFLKTSGGDGTLSVDTSTYPSGSGAVNQIAYWSGTSALTGNAGLTFTTTNGVVVNEDGTSTIDFRVEGDTFQYLINVDASTDNLGFNSATPAEKFEFFGGNNDSSVGFNIKIGGYGFIGKQVSSGFNDQAMVLGNNVKVNAAGTGFVQAVTTGSYGYRAITFDSDPHRIAFYAIDTATTANAAISDSYIRGMFNDFGLAINTSSNTTASLKVNVNVASYKGVEVKLASSQTEDALEIQNSSGTSLWQVDSIGRVQQGGVSALTSVMYHFHNTLTNVSLLKITNSGTGTGAATGLEFGMSNNTDATFWNYNGKIRFAAGNTEIMHLNSYGLTVGGTNTYTGIPLIVHTGSDRNLFVYEASSKVRLDALNDAGTVYKDLLLAGNTITLKVNGTDQVAFGSTALFTDAYNIQLGTTTGTKIGTATSQKLSLWNATPIVQPTTAIAAATFAANTSGIVDDSATFDGYTIGQIVKALRNIGALA